MFKRVERKRKRQEEEKEMDLNDTDSDESDSGSGQELAHSDTSDADIGDGEDDIPISIAEALNNPIYPVSLNPAVYACVLCKWKLIKNAGMAISHKNANAHKRRFEHFTLLSANEDPRSNARELLKKMRSTSNIQREEPQELSKRALKRQAKLAAIREKRKYHKELKAKVIAKRALKKSLAGDKTRATVLSKTDGQMDGRTASMSQNRLERTREGQKSGVISSGKTTKIRDVRTKSTSRTKIPGDDINKNGFSKVGINPCGGSESACTT